MSCRGQGNASASLDIIALAIEASEHLVYPLPGHPGHSGCPTLHREARLARAPQVPSEPTGHDIAKLSRWRRAQRVSAYPVLAILRFVPTAKQPVRQTRRFHCFHARAGAILTWPAWQG